MERDPQGGSDYGLDLRPRLRRRAARHDARPGAGLPRPDRRVRTGQRPHRHAARDRASSRETPEHDWRPPSGLIYPALRPIGTQGLTVEDITRSARRRRRAGATPSRSSTKGRAGCRSSTRMTAGAFDIIVNGDHLLSWGVGRERRSRTPRSRNLAAWSASAAWTDEVSGERRLLSSDTGDGWDAARILLPEVATTLTRELGAAGRVLVGLPERHLLIAGTLRPGDDEFAALFAEFVVEHSGGADEPIDRRVFELVDGRLVEFAGTPTTGPDLAGPPVRGRRRDRDDHPRPPGRAQLADGPAQGASCSRRSVEAGRDRASGSSS